MSAMGGEPRSVLLCLSQIMSKKLLLFGFTSAILTLAVSQICPRILYGNDQIAFALTRDGKIKAQIDGRPLNQTLRELATKFSVDLKGITVGSETISLSLSEVSLEELLKKMMRGYNYVLVRPDKSDRLMLMVLSRADRTKYVDPPAQAPSPAPAIPQPAPQSIPQKALQASPVPAQPQQTQRPTPSPVPSRNDSSQPLPPSGGSAGVARRSAPVPTASGLSPDMYPPVPPSDPLPADPKRPDDPPPPNDDKKPDPGRPPQIPF